MTRFDGEPYEFPKTEYVFPYVKSLGIIRNVEYIDFCIYKITSPIGRIYIGQTKNPVTRMGFYRRNLAKTQRLLGESINKYGWDSHEFVIIDICSSRDLANSLEVKWIKEYDTYKSNHGLNLTIGGHGDCSFKLTEEQINKRTASCKSKPRKPQSEFQKLRNKTKRKPPICIKAIVGMTEKNSIPIFCITNQQAFKSREDAARKLQINSSGIWAMMAGKQRIANGYTFKPITIEEFLN